MAIDIIERDMIIMPSESKLLELSNAIPASSSWAPTRAPKSLAICVMSLDLLLSTEVEWLCTYYLQDFIGQYIS